LHLVCPTPPLLSSTRLEDPRRSFRMSLRQQTRKAFLTSNLENLSFILVSSNEPYLEVRQTQELVL
jgi:hypothetical protein